MKKIANLLAACDMAVDTLERLGAERGVGRIGSTLDKLDAALQPK